MPFAKQNDCQIHYELKGQGTPTVFINGFTNHLGMWDYFIPAFAESFLTLRFDNRGAGRSDTPPGPYSIDQMGDDLIFLMDTLSLEKANLVGSSMGTLIIQSTALRHPKRFGKIVMLSPFNRFPTSSYLEAINTAKLRNENINRKLLFEKTLPWFHSSDYLSDPGNVQTVIENLENNPYPSSPEGYSRQLEALYSFDQTNLLKQIDHEAFLLAGAEDLLTPLYTAQALKTGMKGATLEVLPKTGHRLHIERKFEVLNLILPWLLKK